jgi:membrane protein required for colicin V production
VAADAIVLLILLVSAVLAFVRGFVHEVLLIGSWVGAIVFVIFMLPPVQPLAREYIAPEILADVVAGAALFVIALIVFSILTRAISKRVKDSPANAIDRSLGFAFGLARGAILVCLTYLALEWFIPASQQPPWVQNAMSRPLVEKGAGAIRDFVQSQWDLPIDRANESTDLPSKILDSERLVREMMQPDPKNPEEPGSDVDKGYDDRERRRLERLLSGDGTTDE